MTRCNVFHTTISSQQSRQLCRKVLQSDEVRCRVFAVSCSVLQCVAVCCSVLQCVAVWCCSVLQRNLSHITHNLDPTLSTISTLLHTAAYCNTLQHTAAHCSTLQHTATHCSTQQHTATNCSMLQLIAAHCSTLQHGRLLAFNQAYAMNGHAHVQSAINSMGKDLS